MAKKNITAIFVYNTAISIIVLSYVQCYNKDVTKNFSAV